MHILQLMVAFSALRGWGPDGLLEPKWPVGVGLCSGNFSSVDGMFPDPHKVQRKACCEDLAQRPLIYGRKCASGTEGYNV